ncbi:myrcene synthase, chloroplastic-like [Humulus lupulus]|uniref:myrcene synthase, chloroplastic-like n=1 Tax=Humulus lupulus TaxID=3486 RepID=UPI002B4014DE|nr:myrcene synthase, chloroplastic-like [Humulus lupulus]
MQYMAIHHQFTSLVPICSSSFGRLIATKTSTITTITSRSSTCYPIKCTVVNSPRRSANYEPPIWSFDYIQSLTTQYKGEPYTSQLNKLEGDVKRILVETENSLAQLELIDLMQRLGISYHFENEINTILKKKYTSINNDHINDPNYNLYAIALEFRLLRQHGYAVAQEIFSAFKDETGKFNKARINDNIMGVLALYEASFYEKKDESILEEARIFTTECLKNYVVVMEQNKLSEDNIILISHALEIPLHWRTTRMEARWFIDVYEKREGKNSTLLEFAKLDFNMVQSTHQEDLKHLSRWWKHTKLGEKLNFARDRLMECFLWKLGVTFEAEFSYYRRISARLYVLITVIDDIYDVYGTLEELELFSNAVERWDVKAIKRLPDYMKMLFFVLFNTINEMTFDVLGENNNFVTIEYLKNSWAELCRSYLQEAKWFYSGYKPTLQEYIENSWISIGTPLILLHAYLAFTNPITKEALECLEEGYPTIIRQAAMILRFADDLATLSNELKRGDVPKSIQCYMHDTGASEDQARDHIKLLISKTWKEMNHQNEYNSHFSKIFLQICKSLTRTSLFIYQYGDGHASQDNLSKKRVLELIDNPILM